MEKLQNQVTCGKPLLNLTFFIDSKSKFKISVYSLTKLIKDELGGNISFTLNPKVDYVITNSSNYLLNKSSSTSSLNNVKLINDSYFIEQQIKQKGEIRSLLNDTYLITSSITPTTTIEKVNNTMNNDYEDDQLKIIINPKYIPSVCYGVNEVRQPFFPEEYLILKSNLLSSTIIGKQNTNKFFYLELHQSIDKDFKKYYRIYTQFGRTDEIHKSNSQHRYCEVECDLKDAMLLYSSIYSQKINSDNGYKEVQMSNITKIGSKLKLEQLKKLKEHDSNSSSLTKLYNEETGELEQPSSSTSLFQRSYIDNNVCKLIDVIYKEASKCLIKNFSIEVTENGIETQLGTLSLPQIEEAKLILDQINNELCNGSDNSIEKLEELSSNFYQLVPSKIQVSNKNRSLSKSIINSFDSLIQLSELLDMMKDLTIAISSNKLIYESKNHLDMKYYSLNTDIQHLHPASADYQIFIRNFLSNKIHQDAIDNGKIQILNCFKLEKQIEIDNKHCQGDEGNIKFLYHGSKTSNMVGLLSRGILLPNVITQKGGKRTDFGYLGSGIYFSDNIITSQYTTPINNSGGSMNGSRLIFMSTVSLGKVKEFTKIQPSLSCPPIGYHSCKGVKSSDFKNDEYVIYNQTQTKLSFLIEFIELKK